MNASSFPSSSGSDTARIFAARIPAFFPPLMATVAQGMPPGIWTMEYRESTPPRSEVFIGMPMTGSGNSAAHMPGRWAALPAPAMITLYPRSFADFAH